MKIATILFTYNRPEHTQKVIDGLKNNTLMPDKMFVFQDGPRQNDNYETWNDVGVIISGIDFCDCEIIRLKENKGLSRSITDGISDVLEEYDAVIVLEDDCIPMPQFMKYMNDALIYYKDNKEVYSIAGYSPPINYNSSNYDAYVAGRIESWGWATWKDRWVKYYDDARILGNIKRDAILRNNLQIWGPDFEDYLISTIYGRSNSWAVFWGLTVIYYGGVCLYPNKSLVNCIGCDGSGEHCEDVEVKSAELDERREYLFRFPNDVNISDEIVLEYSKYYHCVSKEERCIYYKNLLMLWIEKQQCNICIKEKIINYKKIVVWGTGKICTLMLNEICEKIDFFVESVPSARKMFMGKRVMTYDNITSDVDLIIIVPGYDKDWIIKTYIRNFCNRVCTIDELLNS